MTAVYVPVRGSTISVPIIRQENMIKNDVSDILTDPMKEKLRLYTRSACLQAIVLFRSATPPPVSTIKGSINDWNGNDPSHGSRVAPFAHSSSTEVTSYAASTGIYVT